MMKRLANSEINKQDKHDLDSKLSLQKTVVFLQYTLINTESDSDKPIEVWFNPFDLCNEKLEFVEIHSSAKINPTCFEAYSIDYVQCDHCFGGEFTAYIRYVLDEVNTKKFYESFTLTDDPILLSKLIQLEFSGADALRTLEEYCKVRNISYTYTFKSEE
ncbi:MAG: hypothetical protein WCI62_01335, partial [Erysipelotrichaceae bacterium]